MSYSRSLLGRGFFCALLLASSAAVASPDWEKIPPAPPALPLTDHGIQTLHALLSQPEDEIDLAKAKLAIDRLVDPSVDADATLAVIEEWATKVRARTPPGATNNETLRILLSTLYEPGAWNDHRPFRYDYSDPFAGSKDPRTSFLSTYLERREGQCVVMPVALVLIGQRLGLPLTLTTAPRHVIAKYGDGELGAWINVEATSGRVYPDSVVEEAHRIPELAIDSGIYLRPHAPREAVALLAVATLLPYYKGTERAGHLLAATDLILAANPRDVVAMTFRADAYYLQVMQRLTRTYPVVEAMPPAYRTEFNSLATLNKAWYDKAEALGWRLWTQEDVDRYRAMFERQKTDQQGGGQ